MNLKISLRTSFRNNFRVSASFGRFIRLSCFLHAEKLRLYLQFEINSKLSMYKEREEQLNGR